MSLYRKEALEVIAFNKRNPEDIVWIIQNSGNLMKKHMYLTDKDHTTWLFTLKGNTLLAYSPVKDRYVEIYKKEIAIHEGQKNKS
jgi:hypothetical protein